MYECVLSEITTCINPWHIPNIGFSFAWKRASVEHVNNATRKRACNKTVVYALMLRFTNMRMMMYEMLKKRGMGISKSTLTPQSRISRCGQMALGPARKPVSTMLRTER